MIIVIIVIKTDLEGLEEGNKVQVHIDSFRKTLKK